MSQPVLTIGMATYKDPSVWWVLVTLRDQLHAAGLLDQVRFLVVNNCPDDPLEQDLRDLCRGHGVQYVHMPDPVGTAPPRNRVFRESQTPWTLCVDSHIYLPLGVVPRLVTWCQNTQSRDLYQGVLLRSHLFRGDTYDLSWTHWRSEMGGDGLFGRSAINPAAHDPETPPFLIPGGGMGLFLSMTAHWLGFHPQFRQFGVEGYVQRKYYQQGRKVWCLPWLRWVHKFRSKRERQPYPHEWRERCRNSLLGWQELGHPKFDVIYQAFVGTPGRVQAHEWRELLQELGINEREVLAAAEKPKTAPAIVADAPLSAADQHTLQQLPCRHRGRRSGTVLCNQGCPSQQATPWATFDCRRYGLVTLSSVRKDLRSCVACQAAGEAGDVRRETGVEIPQASSLQPPASSLGRIPCTHPLTATRNASPQSTWIALRRQ